VSFFEAYEERKKRREQRELERKARKEEMKRKVTIASNNTYFQMNF
jgi:hypothetical protein